jgi:hypothetical protein
LAYGQLGAGKVLFRLATIALMIKKLVILALLVVLGAIAAKRLRGD